MDNNNNAMRNQKRKEKRKMKKKKSVYNNGNQNNNPSKNQQNNENLKKSTNFPNKIISSSPRPKTLLKNNLEINMKRNSGSEFEDFQTPSTELDIKGDYIIENGNGDFNDGYEKEWEEFSTFSNQYLGKSIEPQYHNEMIKENGIKPNERINCRIFETNKDVQISNGDMLKDITLNNNEFAKKDIIEKVIIEEKNCNLNTYNNNSLTENCKNHNNNISPEKNEQGEEEECINNENYARDIDEFFEDLDDECYKYPIEEMIDEGIISNSKSCTNMDIGKDVNEEELCLKNTSERSGPYNQISVKEENDKDRNMSISVLNLICTDENLQDEILIVEHLIWDGFHETTIPKSMTLKPRSSIYSATSITNVTSISDDNFPLHSDSNMKKTKKNKLSKLKIYTKLMNKFRKGKSPEKETPKIETFGCTPSLKSMEILKDSEIESNQSLNSYNETDNDSLKNSLGDLKKKNTVELNLNVVENSCNDINTNIQKKDEKHIEVKTQTFKTEKPKLFMNILKMKPKKEKHSNEKNVAKKLPEKKENVLKIKAKIEPEVIEKFTETLKSLEYDEIEKISDEIVVIKIKKETHSDVHVNLTEDSKKSPFYNEDGDDHFFPDHITKTKIFDFQSLDIPFIDDVLVTQSDSISFYNGESRILKINPDFFAPKASMESLYFPDETIKNEIFPKSLISQSSTKKKKGLGNLFGCMSRGR